MKKNRVAWITFLSSVILFAVLVLPTYSFAAISMDKAVYTAPAAPTYAGFTSGANLVLYTPGSDYPEFMNVGTATTGLLTTLLGQKFGSTTPGLYHVLQPLSAGCSAKRYGECTDANSSMPGANEFVFTIYATAAASGGSVTAYDDTTMRGIIALSTAFFLFLASFFGIVWLLKKR